MSNKAKTLEVLQQVITGIEAQSLTHRYESKLFASAGFGALAEKYADHAAEEKDFADKFIDRLLDLGGELKQGGAAATPLTDDIEAFLQYDKKVSEDGLAAINTIQSLMGIDLNTFEPQPNVNGKSTFGGYSGIAVKPIGLRCVAQIRQASNLPILGTGGVSSWQDAAEYMAVGADAVQVCTEVMLNGYQIIENLKRGLLSYLESKQFNSPSDLKNRAIANLSAHKDLNKSKQVYPEIDYDSCIKCQKCVMLCDQSEHSALSFQNGHIELNKARCVGCSLCKQACPKLAISMR